MNESLNNSDLYETVEACPWCGNNSTDSDIWCEDEYLFKTVQCKKCLVIYVKNRLNQNGRNKFYSNYYGDVQQAREDLTNKRREMYRVDHNYIESFINSGKVLDVGCSDGSFLSLFSHSWERWGVEFGKEAFVKAKNHFNDRILYGEFPELIEEFKNISFDLIIFRGLLEHVTDPKRYLETAKLLLKKNGVIFIGSVPNRNSLCANLFRNKWNQHCPESHIIHFSPDDFKQYFQKNNFELLSEDFFYLNTPYANVDNDIRLIKKAIETRARGGRIKFESPPFWDNLITMLFKKH